MPQSDSSTPRSHDLAAVRDRLLAQREEIIDLYRQDLRSGQSVADEKGDDVVDRANNAYSRELMFALSGAERETLKLLDLALERIEAGSYGSCTHCQRPIGKPRLEAVPWARYCIDCQEMAETGMLQEDGNHG